MSGHTLKGPWKYSAEVEMRHALETAEWGGMAIYGDFGAMPACPCCSAPKHTHDGTSWMRGEHEPSCVLARALSAARGEEGKP